MWWLRIQAARFGRRRRDPEFEDAPVRSVRLGRRRLRLRLRLPWRVQAAR